MANVFSSDLKVRVISALALLPVILFVLWYGGPLFRGFIAIAGLLMIWEWLTLVNADRLLKYIFMVFAAAAMIAAFRLDTSRAFGHAAAGIVAAFLASLTLGFIFRQKQYAWIGTGILMTGFPILAFMWLRDAPHGGALVLWLLLVVWATDIGGYFAGRAIGGPKLAPKISPKKTWAGLAGGILLAVILGLAVASYFHFDRLLWAAMAASALAILAQTGDILESRAKRHFGKKDSGKLIPGHGGIFDRVDGLLLTAPAFALGQAYMNLAGE